jgi:hypoxanthine-guanine phosphoribosyltransferase
MSDFNTEKFKKKLKKKIKKNITNNKNFTIQSNKGSIYFLGFLGSAIYYVSTATDFWIGVLGLLKAAVWPAFLVYASLKGLGA